jgi:hypothetical protein
MTRIVSKLPYFNKRIGKQPTKGQSLVEFALVSVLLFTLLFGILEMGRFMFIFSQVASASQEGTRYAVSHPREIEDPARDPGTSGCSYPCGLVEDGGAHSADPCNIIYQAKSKVVLVPTTGAGGVSVEVGYDDGNGTTVNPFSLTANPSLSSGTVRAVVTATYQIHFLVGIFDRFIPNGLAVRMVSARTIPNDPDHSDTRLRCDYDAFGGPTPTPLACQTISINRVQSDLKSEGNPRWDSMVRYRLYDPYGNEITSGPGVTISYYTTIARTTNVKTVTLVYSGGAWTGSGSCNYVAPAMPASGTVYTTINVTGSYSTIPYPSCSLSSVPPKNDTATIVTTGTCP